jgi:hypothetical protein
MKRIDGPARRRGTVPERLGQLLRPARGLRLSIRARVQQNQAAGARSHGEKAVGAALHRQRCCEHERSETRKLLIPEPVVV